MAIGNEWLGSLVDGAITDSQNLLTSSMVVNSPALTNASVVDYISLSLDQAMTELVTINLMPSAGAGFTAPIYQTTTSGKAGVFYRFEGRPMFLGAGDRIQVHATNTQISGNVHCYVMQLY
jgi:hypothetical protein